MKNNRLGPKLREEEDGYESTLVNSLEEKIIWGEIVPGIGRGWRLERHSKGTRGSSGEHLIFLVHLLKPKSWFQSFKL